MCEVVERVPSLREIFDDVKGRLRCRIIEDAEIEDEAVIDSICKYSSISLHFLIENENFTLSSWHKYFGVYFKFFCKDYNSILDDLYTKYKDEHLNWKVKYGNQQNDDLDTICDCNFSLAYGATLLLENTKLKLVKGHVYGICGPNGAGKSTLLNSIAQNKLEGFSSNEEVSRKLVEFTSIDEELDNTNVIDYLNVPNISQIDRDKIISGANIDLNQFSNSTLGSLSGGWKMKVMLVKALLENLDLLLLDEPTNHLDKSSVSWLIQYIKSCKSNVILIVSHDFDFMDVICTDIINFENKKLRYYEGSMSNFLKLFPNFKDFYKDIDSKFKIKIPPPAFLQGVNSNTRAILKATNVTYVYPNATKPSIKNVSIKICLSSRIGLVGPNGAGKSTLVQLLSGDLVPTSGTVWKHPNIRIGYIAQHSFNHLEQHLEKTPNEYIHWRYLHGEDRELTEKESRLMLKEDIEALKRPLKVNGFNRYIESVVGRQKLKRSFRYEIKWVGYLHKDNTYVSREDLIANGLEKLVQKFDDREAGREGQNYKELKPSAICSHIEGVFLDKEIINHTPIKGLSGGQKVKLVIAAATWNNPHILVLDEPTNFLDKSAVSALSTAMAEWGGAVIIISHDTSFIDVTCSEILELENGQLKSSNATRNNSAPIIDDPEKEITIKVKPKKLTRNQIKAREVRRRARYLKWLAEGGEREPDTDDEC